MFIKELINMRASLYDLMNTHKHTLTNTHYEASRSLNGINTCIENILVC